MDVETPPFDPIGHVVRRPRRARRLLAPAAFACILAVISVFATSALLDEPEPTARLAALWRSIPEGLDGPDETSATHAVGSQAVGTDRMATGSIAGAVSGEAEATGRAFGADLGTGQSLASLHALWSRMAASIDQSDLRPVAAIRDVGHGHELHLLAGPFANAADASALCARLSDAAPGCAVVPYLGQDLTNP